LWTGGEIVANTFLCRLLLILSTMSSQAGEELNKALESLALLLEEIKAARNRIFLT
jgi:hypothetical protein